MPTVDLRINGRALALVPLPLWRGEPVIAEVVLRHPDRAAKEPLLLDPPGGGWSTRVKVTVTDASGAAAPWPFVVVGRPSDGALALRPGAVTTLVLRVESPATPGLSLGRHRLVARLEFADGRGWRGVVESEAVEVERVEPPAAPTGAALGRRQLLRARDALLAGDLPRAEAAAKEMVQADPARSEGFVARALVSEARGEARPALLAIDMAIARAAGAPGAEPAPGAPAPKPKPVPFEYYDLRRRFEALLAANEPEPVPVPVPVPEPPPAAPKPVTPPAAGPDETVILGDPRGQWATSGEASSEFGSPPYGARQAVGAPDVRNFGDRPEAWASKSADGGAEWLKLTFARPVRASAVRVRQNLNPGAIMKVEALAADGRSAVVWSGSDTTAYAKGKIVWFVATFEPPAFPVSTIKLTLDSAAVKGWNQIDAVQLVGDP